MGVDVHKVCGSRDSTTKIRHSYKVNRYDKSRLKGRIKCTRPHLIPSATLNFGIKLDIRMIL